MTAGQGDRGGKKPKYRIRDIGGVELNSEDKPTERVLNFLMKGETIAATSTRPVPENPSTIVPDPQARKALSPDSEPHPKRSLDSLFERAGHAATGTTEPLIPDRTREILNPPPLEPSPSLPSKTVPTGPRPERSLPRVARAAEEPVPSDLVAMLEDLKKKRRLSKGEFKVLMVLALECRAGGSDSCYVKIHQLMVDAELKERQTQMVLRNLRELGLIEKVAEYSNLDRLGTQYRICFESF